MNLKNIFLPLSLASFLYPSYSFSYALDIKNSINYYPESKLEKILDLKDLDEDMIDSYKLKDTYLDNLDYDKARIKIKELIDSDYGTYIFGNYLDELTKERRIPKKPKENFLVDEMDLSIIVDRSKLKIYVMQEYNNENILLMEMPVALGGDNIDNSTGEKRKFNTPLGNFYIKRIVNMPIWYPPSWSKYKTPPKPGKNNPYGEWMMELTNINNLQLNYNYSLSGDTGYRIHSTNNPNSIGTYSSYGCIRVHPDTAKELFNAILRYKKHMQEKEVRRGIVFPLYRTIPVKIIP
jgi:lipoprotein-anchoring transpeptidase ErfK/SrfK